MPSNHRFNGQVLHQLRKDRNWSLDELAQRSGLSVSHLSALEKGARKSPSVDYVYQVSNALSISMYRLLNLSPAATDGDTPYPETPSPANSYERIAEDVVAWSRESRPDRVAFILNPEAEDYLNLAQKLYENRHSSATALQLLTDFIQKLNTKDE